ncbi:tyrosine-type recombinase/integrase [Holdemania massiliensis]|uniref:tyrosine-type recombinase/integrase n=1 Tax=Holdemania massiliensis TaxID=1468449 RepID=UPI001F05B8BF|nr:tyrosine-type recombinase/integrase [Holdemania massiliensis]MCH1942164.1 site-specific integrase [Holdemania massiliensis]
MKENILTSSMLEAFRHHLIEQEHSPHTIEKYIRDIRSFYQFLPQEKNVSKEQVIAYKSELTGRYKTTSVNSMLTAVNQLLAFLDWRDCQVRLLKVQRTNFRVEEKELSREEYQKLLRTAQPGNERLWLLMQAICSTGIRVSEHQFITVEAVQQGQVRIRNKGRERLVFIPETLKKPLLKYCRRHQIQSGAIFITRTGKPMNRSNIWSAMKKLCRAAGVDQRKVFPHNLRHLFALTYYRMEKDIVRLADVLGHTSVETTRIYTATSGQEQRRLISRLGLTSA